jgi:predicted RNA-binding Zn-ribbon protein involved in translation (DUF1610 family)
MLYLIKSQTIYISCLQRYLVICMSFKIPDSMDECLYFTRRTLNNDGRVMAWVERKDCISCGKAKMGKPVDKGKIKIRATEYICPACGASEEKKAHEESCTVKIIYTCPYCKNQGETTAPYKRKKFEGVDAVIFECQKCSEKIGITKKMADPKKKKKK